MGNFRRTLRELRNGPALAGAARGGIRGVPSGPRRESGRGPVAGAPPGHSAGGRARSAPGPARGFGRSVRRIRRGAGWRGGLLGTHFFVAERDRERADRGLLAHLGSDGSALVVRAADAIEAATYRARLEAAGIGVTASQFSQQFAFGVGQQAETLLWVAEHDLEKARATIGLDCAADCTRPALRPEEAEELENLRDRRRFAVMRLLLYAAAAISIFQGLVLLFSPGVFVGSASQLWGVLLVGLALWSKREPARAFGVAWGVVLAGTVIIVVLAPPGTEMLRVPDLLATVMLYFAWRHASDREQEKKRGRSGSADRPLGRAT